MGTLLAERNVLGVYPDLDRAREAIGALELAGIEGAHISLLGPQVEEAAGKGDTSERDAKMLGHVGRRTGAGAAAGTAIGGAAGFLVGLAAFSVPGLGPVIGAGVWAATVGGGTAGGAVGGILGAESALRNTDAWDLTFEHVRGGSIVVGVHTDDEKQLATAVEALSRTEAEQLRAYDAEGNETQLGN